MQIERKEKENNLVRINEMTMQEHRKQQKIIIDRLHKEYKTKLNEINKVLLNGSDKMVIKRQLELRRV